MGSFAFSRHFLEKIKLGHQKIAWEKAVGVLYSNSPNGNMGGGGA